MKFYEMFDLVDITYQLIFNSIMKLLKIYSFYKIKNITMWVSMSVYFYIKFRRKKTPITRYEHETI